MSRHVSAVVLMFLLGPTVLAWPLPSPAQGSPEFTIVKIKVPELDLFDDKGNKVGVLATSKVALPLDVVTRAANGRLKITAPDGRQVWIDSMYVTYQPSHERAPAVAPCDPGRGVTVGATRGSGARCK
jgi:hypothetical protein